MYLDDNADYKTVCQLAHDWIGANRNESSSRMHACYPVVAKLIPNMTAHRTGKCWYLCHLSTVKMCTLTLETDGDEPSALKHRFAAIAIDKSKNSAVGYIARYISKILMIMVLKMTLTAARYKKWLTNRSLGINLGVVFDNWNKWVAHLYLSSKNYAESAMHLKIFYNKPSKQMIKEDDGNSFD